MKDIICLKEVRSTNDYMQQLAATDEDAPEGLLVWTNHQTAGRGLNQNKWESEKEANLTFSLLLYPSFLPVSEQFLLSQITSLGIIDFLSNYCKIDNLSIKWPNDIYWKEKKICGILIENLLKGSMISHAIIGVGLNMNQKKFTGDAPNPVSVVQITGKKQDLSDSVIKVKEAVLNRYLQLLKDKKSQIRNDYFAHLYRNAGWHIYEDVSGKFKAKIKDVQDSGLLVLEAETGEERIYAFKEVSFVH